VAISQGEIERWVSEDEGETLEFKTSSSQGSRLSGAKSVCAFLNTEGGRLLFGVDPKGQIAGQEVSEKTLRSIRDQLGEIDPPSFPSIDRVEIGAGKAVVVVTVERGQTRPYAINGSRVSPSRVFNGRLGSRRL
jgi:ATP-dependent DNA helicase RecG